MNMNDITDISWINEYRNQAKRSCTLSFVVPGFMKAGTTYLFDLLSKHPQILLALKGVVFKETGCYYTNSFNKNVSYERMNCFPFIESHDVSYVVAVWYYMIWYVMICGITYYTIAILFL